MPVSRHGAPRLPDEKRAGRPGWDGPLGNLWPPEVDNVQFVSNMNPQGPVVPGAGMLYCKGPTHDFEYDNNGLIAQDLFGIGDSLEK